MSKAWNQLLQVRGSKNTMTLQTGPIMLDHHDLTERSASERLQDHYDLQTGPIMLDHHDLTEPSASKRLQEHCDPTDRTHYVGPS